MEKKILVIEDEPDIREAIAETLTDAGFTVFTAENGAQGIEIAFAEHPDLILLDIIMPIMDGHATLAKLRQDPWGKTAKVVMLTSMEDAKNIAEAHEEHIEDYIIKVHNSLEEILKKTKRVLYTS
jgi:CheY-like chemotaxis protein